MNSTWRRDIKARRRELSPQFLLKASQEISHRIKTQMWFLRSERIAFYLPVNGEVNTQFLIHEAWQMGKSCYLPLLHPLKHNSLQFAAYHPEQNLVKNRYGIDEPKVDNNTHIIAPWALDLVFVPMVAFDAFCHRMGTGGGYYDRTFSFVKDMPQKPRPRLVGLAYEFQNVGTIQPEEWDVRMDKVITESASYCAEEKRK